ncbi:MAG TPA: hypothetical protein VK661_00990 [Planctomycetota bacterium]|nr:hypothetical protein [Planctomycetota bacterium]
MKLAEHLKPGVSVEIQTFGGQTILLGGKGEAHRLEQVDDDEQVLFLQTIVVAGRMKGQKVRMILPYAAIATISLPA